MEKFNEDDGVWRTIRGRRVFIREGESVESAMSRSGKFSRVEKNKDKYDKINKFKERKQSNLKVKYKKTDTGVEVDEEDRKRIMKELGYDKDNLSKNFDAKDNKYEMKKEEREKVLKKLGLRNDDEDTEEPTPIRKDEQDTKRRSNLMRYTQENKDKIAQYGREYDEETNKQAFEKAKRGEELSSKEYYGMIGSQERPGDIITDVTADGEDVIVAKDGQWVRKSRIQAYNDNPSANKDAIVDLAEEERKIDEREKINRFKERKQSNNKAKDDEKEINELSKQLAREIYGSHISDSVAERYGKELQTLSEGAVLDNYADWEFDKKKLRWTKEGMQNRLIYLQKGYDASRKHGEEMKRRYKNK